MAIGDKTILHKSISIGLKNILLEYVNNFSKFIDSDNEQYIVSLNELSNEDNVREINGVIFDKEEIKTILSFLDCIKKHGYI